MLPAYANSNKMACPSNIAEAGNIRSSGCHLLGFEEPPPRKNSRPSVSGGNVPGLKWLRRANRTAVDEKPFLVSLLAFRVSRSGHFWRRCGRGRPPPLCSRLRSATAGQSIPHTQPRKWHRPSASHSRRITRNAIVALFTLLLSKLIHRLKKWGNS
jgi:hypothetical protein